MKSVGEILKSKRLEIGMPLEEIQKQTKIGLRFLEAIERDDFDCIPNCTTTKGFIRNYALCLGLPPDYFLAVFRRDYVEKKTGTVLPRSILKPAVSQRSWWTPKATLIAIIFTIVLVVSGYFGRQYYYLTSGPNLILESPKDGQIFTGKVLVGGNTDPDAVVSVQGILITVSEKGSFSEEMVLPRGDNIITVESTNRQNKTRMVKVRVKVE